jgi:type II secretory pathway component PulF
MNKINLKKYLSPPHLSTREQSFFMKRLSFLIRAGIPVLESLTIIAEQTGKKNHALIFKTIGSDVAMGQNLSTSLGKFKKMFGDFSINIIAFGEATGMLAENLEYLANELKKKDALKKKIVSAFIYPAIITLATFFITGFLMIYLFPKIIPVFASLRIKLPLSTKIVIFLSNFLTHHGFILILVLVLLGIAFLYTLNQNGRFHFWVDKNLMKIPIVGKIIQGYNLANITRTLGLLLKSGMPINESLEITSNTSANLVYKKELRSLAKVVDRGELMSAYLATLEKLFPDIMTQIISVGERSGDLPQSLIYLSELYENEVDDFTKNLSNTIEPILMIVMGVMIGFIAISIITPIYGITQHLQTK